MYLKQLRFLLILSTIGGIPISGSSFDNIIEEDSLTFESKSQTEEVVPKQSISQLFESLYGQSDKLEPSDALQEPQALTALHFSDSVQIGFDSMQEKLQKNIEINSINSHLAPKVAQAKGYGIQMTVILD